MASPELDDDDTDPDIERKLQARDLSVEGRSLAYIAEKIGVSKTTAWRWVQAGEEYAIQLDYLERVRGRRTGVAVMDMVKAWMFDLREDPDVTIDQQILAAQTVIKAEERRDRLGGFEAPRQIEVGSPGARPFTVNGRVARSIENYRAGGDPVDQGGDGTGQGPDGGSGWR